MFGGDHSASGGGGVGISRFGGVGDNLVEGGGVVIGGPPPEDPRQCVPFQVDYCRKLPYNFTSFPNAMGHRDIGEAKHDIERFK